jgi:DnaJ-class molecular chaperone
LAKDFYEVLGVSKTASDKELRSAYRRLARKLHPDVNPNDRASEERFKEVNAAYDVLSDAEKRKKYDKYGENWEHADELERAQRARGNTRTRYFYGNGPGGIEFSEGDGDFGDLGDLFGGIFSGRGGGRRGRQPQRNLNTEQPVDITLEEAFHGTTRLLAAEVDGSGPRRIEVKIPPGVTNGSRVRVAGEGREGLDGRRGDLYLVVNVRPHDRYERKGDDLYVDVEVPLTTAVLGGEVDVQSIDKKVALKLPPLTQNGRTFRLGGLGMPKLGQGGRGDLYARVKARLPEELGEKERELFQELKAAGV